MDMWGTQLVDDRGLSQFMLACLGDSSSSNLMTSWKAVWPFFFGRNPYLDHFSRMVPVAVFGRTQPVFFNKLLTKSRK